MFMSLKPFSHRKRHLSQARLYVDRQLVARGAGCFVAAATSGVVLERRLCLSCHFNCKQLRNEGLMMVNDD